MCKEKSIIENAGWVVKVSVLSDPAGQRNTIEWWGPSSPGQHIDVAPETFQQWPFSWRAFILPQCFLGAFMQTLAFF